MSSWDALFFKMLVFTSTTKYYRYLEINFSDFVCVSSDGITHSLSLTHTHTHTHTHTYIKKHFSRVKLHSRPSKFPLFSKLALFQSFTITNLAFRMESRPSFSLQHYKLSFRLSKFRISDKIGLYKSTYYKVGLYKGLCYKVSLYKSEYTKSAYIRAYTTKSDCIWVCIMKLAYIRGLYNKIGSYMGLCYKVGL